MMIMIEALTCAVPRETWQHSLAETNGVPRPVAKNVKDAGPWAPCVQEIGRFEHLGDNWDGAGAKAPSDELLNSAFGHAAIFHFQGMPAPSRVVPGLAGTVIFEWQLPDGGYAEVEIVRPLFAEVMLIEPGQPAKHWTLPTEE